VNKEPDRTPARLTDRARREAAIQALSQGFADDRLSLEEFEARVELAIKARTEDDLERLLADLPAPLPAPVSTSRPVATTGPTTVRTRPANPERDERRQYVVAVLSGATRKGEWEPSRNLFAYAFWGGAELDFREAALAPGVTNVTAIGIMGGIDIIVPPGVAVDVEGFALLGGIDQVHERGAGDDPGAPRIRVQGFAMMGGVHVSVRQAGESKRQAARRRRATRKSLKRGS
jgi:hypothetical protein